MDNLKQNLVNCITYSLNSEVPEKKYSLGLDSHNYERSLKGDVINSNLKKNFSDKTYIVHKFQKGGWEGRFIIDLGTKTIVSITTEQNLKRIPAVKDRKIPHYMQSCLNVINTHVYSPKQLTFMETGNIFCNEEYEEDFKRMISLDINFKEFTYYVITYDFKHSIVKNIKWYLMDKNFIISKCESLNYLMKPDYSELTSNLLDKKENEENNKSTYYEEPRKGIKLGLKKDKKINEA